MEAQINTTERIEFRISAYDKRIFQKAQELCGDKSFNNFILRIAKTRAEEIVRKNEQIIASESDRNLFFDTIFADSEPNSNLITAAQKYKSHIASL
ncbi:MAG: DUF1778 domain-containing protein [Mangrovibacterium sp.]